MAFCCSKCHDIGHLRKNCMNSRSKVHGNKQDPIEVWSKECFLGEEQMDDSNEAIKILDKLKTIAPVF